MDTSGSRRQVLLGAGASLAAAAVPSLARAQAAGSDPLSQLLGQALPQQLRAILPKEAFQAADFVSSLIKLEGEAKTLKLPGSPLSPGEAPLPTDPDRLYELALPRLVALIDRSELRNLGFADRAGGLLARLHDTQYVAPSAFGSAQILPEGGAAGALRMAPGEEAPIGSGLPQIDLPEIEPPEIEPPRIDLPLPAVAAVAAPEPAAPRLTVKRSLRFADLAEEYAAYFASAEFNPAHRQSADWHLTMMGQSKARYAAVGKRTGVPWFFIAAIHGLEASFNFRAHFHNGDFPLSARTRQVPAGRPVVWLPPSDWESSTADALRLMGFAGASDWSLPRTLYRLEAFNGFGYRRIGRVTPYLWSFSNHYSRGKFVADGRFNASARSQQCGAAVMLKLLADAGEIAFA